MFVRDGEAQFESVAQMLDVSQSDIRGCDRLVRTFVLYGSPRLVKITQRSCFERRRVHIVRRIFGKNQKRR